MSKIAKLEEINVAREGTEGDLLHSKKINKKTNKKHPKNSELLSGHLHVNSINKDINISRICEHQYTITYTYNIIKNFRIKMTSTFNNNWVSEHWHVLIIKEWTFRLKLTT